MKEEWKEGTNKGRKKVKKESRKKQMKGVRSMEGIKEERKGE